MGARLAHLLAALLASGCVSVRMPGQSHKGPLPPLTEEQKNLVTQVLTDAGLNA